MLYSGIVSRIDSRLDWGANADLVQDGSGVVQVGTGWRETMVQAPE